MFSKSSHAATQLPLLQALVHLSGILNPGSIAAAAQRSFYLSTMEKTSCLSSGIISTQDISPPLAADTIHSFPYARKRL